MSERIPPSRRPCPEVVPAARLKGLRAYRRTQSDVPISLFLDANEGSPAAAAQKLLEQAIREVEINRYPDAANLERKLASRWNIEANRIVVTNGGDDAIDRICRAVIEPGANAVLHDPTFEMISRGVQLAGGEVRRAPWVDGVFPLSAILDLIDEDTKLIALVTPNNPTGGVIALADILAVLDAARQVGATVLIDLAYAEFAETDPTSPLLDRDNAVIVRTFSKALGLAGMRLGYAIAPTRIAEWLRTVGGPYPVSVVSLTLGEKLLGQDDSTIESVQLILEERAALNSLLSELGAHPLDSQANFVTARFQDADAVQKGLARLAISVRGFHAGPMAQYLRITLPGDTDQYARLANALVRVMQDQEALS